MQVSLPALKAFEAAARLGSFKAAADELSLSPTAISHHINNLEERLSVTLFVRKARKVSLTATGEELAVATRHGFHTINAAIEKIIVKTTQINVTTTSSFAALVLIPAVQEFYEQYPGIELNITSGENIEENHFILPIRLGELERQSGADVIKVEQYNLFAAGNVPEQVDSAEPIVIYTTDWKNRDLPKVPLQAWLARNGLESKQIKVKYFDQELFGIQQALWEKAFVFCSTTLLQGYLKAGLLAELNTQAVDSGLCYYIANKEKRTLRHNHTFISWLERLLQRE